MQGQIDKHSLLQVENMAHLLGFFNRLYEYLCTYILAYFSTKGKISIKNCSFSNLSCRYGEV